jgi:hypothetical protein
VDVSGQAFPGQRQGNGSWVFYIERPGLGYKVDLSADLTTAKFAAAKYNWTATMSGFHRLNGYHGGLLYKVWAVIYDLASLSMIVFGISGVYMWYARTKRRALGWAILAAGFIYTTSTIAYLMIAR